ncbi:MAG: ABC transporter ATP-binding protein [Deltaproteobacteria bacterium]|nr:ABC transporter ATP-binding protein [Deltaproteobacteria bacterium]
MRIELASVKKRFGRVEVLKGVDLVIPSGRKLALVGPNGSGKSTLIRALLGLVACEGSIRLDGKTPYENRVALARRLAYVPQVAPALSASVSEVVALVETTRDLPRTKISKVASRLELDLAEIGPRPFRLLSGGMKQKLLLALALAAEPELLVMDEPAASLDVRARHRFFELLGSLPEDVSLILSSHRLDELTMTTLSHQLTEGQPLVHHVVAMLDGRVGFDGGVSDYIAAIEAELSALDRHGGSS